VAPLEKDREDASGVSSRGDAVEFLCDTAGTIRWWSDAAERFFGYTTAEAVGQTLERLFHPEPSGDGDAVSESTPHAWNPRTRQGTIAACWRTVTVLQNGGDGLSLQRVWRQVANVVAGPAGPESPKQHVGTVAARIAHDFSSLLASVIGNVALLEEEIPSAQPMHRRVVAARQAAEAARSFSQRLIALDPKRTLALHPGDLEQVVRDVVPELRAVLPPNIELVTQLDGCSDSVLLDRRQIAHVLLELALNAKDAMLGPGSLVVSVAVSDGKPGDPAGPPPGRWVRLQVSDTGKGMDAALLKHAFEPFVTTKVPSCGIGLGLSTVAAIVRQHEGLLDVQSRPGQGATFSIFLPSRGPLDKTAVPSPSKPQEAPVGPPAAKRNILLVEDNSMVRRSIEATLRGLGYHVVAVASGGECIEVVERAGEPIDLLITDVVMPGMSGKELIERLRAILPDLPVLFMSGYDRSTLASRRQSVAAEHFLQKPFDCEDLSIAVFGAMAGKNKP
jgi:two-component system, cell cycle sensor histidine kinase and response regulator CckA